MTKAAYSKASTNDRYVGGWCRECHDEFATRRVAVQALQKKILLRSRDCGAAEKEEKWLVGVQRKKAEGFSRVRCGYENSTLQRLEDSAFVYKEEEKEGGNQHLAAL